MMDTQTRLAIRTALLTRNVRVEFTKKDGSYRTMDCSVTVNYESGIVERLRELEEICPIDPSNNKPWTVYDKEKLGYRRFSLDCLTSVIIIAPREQIYLRDSKEEEYMEAYNEFKRNL
tara:strand:+ start:210 stop:563 length:354 start_codon:yes stop_codon:yes gene_type:complete